MSIVRVALDVPLHTLFDYRLNEDQVILPGQRVLVSVTRSRIEKIADGARAYSASSASTPSLGSDPRAR